MDIIIKKGKPRGRVRSKIEKNLIKEGWGAGMTEEQIDKCEHIEREAKDKYGADTNFFKQHHIEKMDEFYEKKKK